jgi:TRAF3-interacting protein 1
MNEQISAKTADILGRIVKKAPLNHKLLSRPPFRYLHDVISEVISTTGFGKGLYTAQEMNAENIKDKEAKVAYLAKMIDCVGLSANVFVKVNPLKIVAGLEAEETNLFLQTLGKAAIKKVQN